MCLLYLCAAPARSREWFSVVSELTLRLHKGTLDSRNSRATMCCHLIRLACNPVISKTDATSRVVFFRLSELSFFFILSLVPQATDRLIEALCIDVVSTVLLCHDW